MTLHSAHYPRRLLLAVALLSVGAVLPARAGEADVSSEANQFRFERQLRVNPFDPAALNNLAVVKAGQGRYDDAMDLLQRAARLAPDNAGIRHNLDRLRSWMSSSLGREVDPSSAIDLGGSHIPPDPPRLWNATPPSR